MDDVALGHSWERLPRLMYVYVHVYMYAREMPCEFILRGANELDAGEL